MCRLTRKLFTRTNFKVYELSGLALQIQLHLLGLEIPMGMLDSRYYTTDLEGWGKILYDLVFDSNLYKKDKFDCDKYALKAKVTCAEKYGLNAIGVALGHIPGGYHGFNIFFYAEIGFMLFEPNEGFGYDGCFEIGEHGYKPEKVLI